MNNVEIITVHYQTPEALLRLLQSIKRYEGDQYHIRVIDGSGCKYKEVTEYAQAHKNIKMEYFDYNIHHGPGMNYGISTSESSYIFLVDSDMVIIKSVISKMVNMIKDNYAVGRMVELNEAIVLETEEGMVRKIKYLHPDGMLINRRVYPKFYPFIKHGAPCILTMADIHLQKKEHLLINFPDFQSHIRQEAGGTRQKFGSCLLGIPHRTIEISPSIRK